MSAFAKKKKKKQLTAKNRLQGGLPSHVVVFLFVTKLQVRTRFRKLSSVF